jgi:hypothetical protein
MRPVPQLKRMIDERQRLRLIVRTNLFRKKEAKRMKTLNTAFQD